MNRVDPETVARFERLKEATRFVMFETEVTEWPIGTHGGTAFVVVFEGKPYALTARHVARDFRWNQLCILNNRLGRNIAGLKAVYHAGQTYGAAVETDLGDLQIIEFADHIDAAWFGDAIFNLDEPSMSRAEQGDALVIYGALKEKSTILDGHIAPVFASLGFEDDGPSEFDPTLRICIGQWEGIEFTSVTGMSGGPVFNMTRGGLSGLMLRGGLRSDGLWSAHYLDIPDAVRILRSIHNGQLADRYEKVVSYAERDADIRPW